MKKSFFLLILMVQGALVGEAQEVETRVHEVRRGESLEYIAKKYGVSIDELQHHNMLLDKYFYVGQKLNVPVKKQPEVEHSYSSYSSYVEPVKKKRKGNGFGRFVGNVFATAFGYAYAQPQMYSPVSSYGGGFGNMNQYLDPNMALMQAQQQMGLAQQQLQERWKIEQQSQEFFEQQNKAGENILRGGIPWNAAPVMVDMSGLVPSDDGTGGTGSSSNGHQCRVCGGSGQVVDNTYLGNASQTKWCDICRKEVYVAHHHKKCQTCGGNGWISGY